MRIPLLAPLRVGARFDRPIEAPEDRHRHDWFSAELSVGRARVRPVPHPTSKLHIEIGVMASQKRAAIKPSLTLTRLILPSCLQAP
jgi:hypothetical protein